MNHFSASIVLSQVTAQEYLDMLPEGRLQSFGQYIGVEAIVSFFSPLRLPCSALTLVRLDYV